MYSNNWTLEKIKYKIQESEYNKNNDVFAKYIRENSIGNNIYDVGCGLGYLSLSFCKYFSKVYSIDIDEKPLKFLKEKIKNENIRNIKVIKDDATKYILEKKVSNIVFCFYGSEEEILKISHNNCTGKIFIICRTWKKPRFSANSNYVHRRNSDSICRYLDKINIKYEIKEFLVETGQPLKRKSDIDDFLSLYNRNKDKRIDGSDLDIIKINHDKFNYFIKKECKIAIISFFLSNQ